jgi:hypothetical protein
MRFVSPAALMELFDEHSNTCFSAKVVAASPLQGVTLALLSIIHAGHSAVGTAESTRSSKQNNKGVRHKANALCNIS